MMLSINIPLLFSFLLVFVECSPPESSSPSCKSFNQSTPCGGGQPCPPPIHCAEDGSPVTELNSHLYRVKAVDSTRRTLVIAEFESRFDGSTCPYQMFKPFLDVSPCGYTGRDRLVTLLYNCSAHSPAGGDLHQVPCKPGKAGGPGFFIWTGADTSRWGVVKSCTSVSYAVVDWPALEGRGGDGGGAAGMGEALQAGFEVTWAPQNLSRPSRCEGCVKSGGRCIGYSVPTNVGSCYCVDGLTEVCPGLDDDDDDDDVERKKAKKLTKILAGVVGGGIFLIVCLLLVCFCYLVKLKGRVLWWKKRKDKKLEAFMERFGSLAPKRYSYSDVEKMTSSLSHKLGQGGYGRVYKGQLDDGRLVAVKVLSSSRGSGKDFFSEVVSIGSTYHVNIVSLLGFCFEESHRILIYEFMPNGSLDKFIHNEEQADVALPWEKRLKIAVGIAQGLAYLHHGCNIGILHFDIKPHNILLDENLCPKISDFGLAKLCRSAESVISMLSTPGTPGYIAPEVYSRSFGGASSKSDVYSYGMMLLEIVGGRKNLQLRSHTSEIYFPEYIYKHVQRDGDLKQLRTTTKEEEDMARRMSLVALWCIQTKPTDRPSMSRVVDMLEGRGGEIPMPPMPVLSSSRSP